MPNAVAQPGIRKNALAKNVSTAAAGAVLTYTAPSGKTAEIVSYMDDNINAAVAVAPEHLSGANTFRPDSTPGIGVRATAKACNITLAAGESFRFNVTTAIAVTTADFAIYLYEEA